MTYALDTNLLVYAHNIASPLHNKAKTFVEHLGSHHRLSRIYVQIFKPWQKNFLKK